VTPLDRDALARVRTRDGDAELDAVAAPLDRDAVVRATTPDGDELLDAVAA